MYSNLVLKYKDSKDLSGNVFDNTNKIFNSKYFSGGKTDKKFNEPFVAGEIYSFVYNTDSKVTEKRKFINKNPVVLCTGIFSNKTGTIMKGIDLVTVPNLIRVTILGRVYDNNLDSIKNNNDSYSGKSSRIDIDLSDNTLKSLLVGTGYQNALFGFKTKFINDPKVIDLDDWQKIPYLKQDFLEGLTAESIYKQYQLKLS
jgi:hypothetical protein